MSRVILASGSPRRKELLAALIEHFDVVVSDVPEDPVTGDPAAGAVDLARSKARAVADRYPGATVIGADTVVHDGSRDVGKPAGPDEAREMLSALQGRPHRVATGVAVLRDADEWTASSIARVILAAMSADTIDVYVASGRPLDKAGAYAIQDDDVPTVASFAGCYCSVMGLPLWALRGLLVEAGLEPRDPSQCLARCVSCPDRP